MLSPVKSVFFSATLPGPISYVRSISEHNADHPYTAAFDEGNQCIVLIPKQNSPKHKMASGRWRIPMHMVAAYQLAAKGKVTDDDTE